MHILAAQGAGRHQKAIPAEPAAHAFKRWLTTLEPLREKTNHQSQKRLHMTLAAPRPAPHTRIVYVTIAVHLPHLLQICAIPFEFCDDTFHLCQGARHAGRKKYRQQAERLMTFTAVIARNQCLAVGGLAGISAVTMECAIPARMIRTRRYCCILMPFFVNMITIVQSRWMKNLYCSAPANLRACYPFCSVVLMEPHRVRTRCGSFYESRSLTVFAAAKMSLLLFCFISRNSRFGCELL